MLTELGLFEITNRVQQSVDRLRHFEPEEGYYFANSGGKDSTVVRDLLIKSGVAFDAHYMNTTIDPPPLVKFIRENHIETEMHYPPRPYFKEIVKRGFPMRQQRWCCEFLKEYGGIGRLVVTGIRAQESAKRAQRRMMEPCSKKGYDRKWYLHPILDWEERDVWEYIRSKNIPYCSLYDEGWKRIGCLGCPMAYYKRRIRELDKYPRVKRAYQRAFNELYEKNKGREAYQRWSSGEQMFRWWLSGTGKVPENDNPLFV